MNAEESVMVAIGIPGYEVDSNFRTYKLLVWPSKKKRAYHVIVFAPVGDEDKDSTVEPRNYHPSMELVRTLSVQGRHCSQ